MPTCAPPSERPGHACQSCSQHLVGRVERARRRSSGAAGRACRARRLRRPACGRARSRRVDAARARRCAATRLVGRSARSPGVVAHQEHAVPGSRRRRPRPRGALGLLGQQAGAELRDRAGAPRARRAAAPRSRGRLGWVLNGLTVSSRPNSTPTGRRRHLGPHRQARGVGVARCSASMSRQLLGVARALQQRERQRPARPLDDPPQHGELLGRVVEVGDDLQHALAGGRHAQRDAGQLVLAGGQRRRSAAVGGAVVQRARGARSRARRPPSRAWRSRPWRAMSASVAGSRSTPRWPMT